MYTSIVSIPYMLLKMHIRDPFWQDLFILLVVIKSRTFCWVSWISNYMIVSWWDLTNVWCTLEKKTVYTYRKRYHVIHKALLTLWRLKATNSTLSPPPLSFLVIHFHLSYPTILTFKPSLVCKNLSPMLLFMSQWSLQVFFPYINLFFYCTLSWTLFGLFSHSRRIWYLQDFGQAVQSLATYASPLHTMGFDKIV